MDKVLDKVRGGGYEFRNGVRMARVTAVPKKERNIYPAFFYDEEEGWGIVGQDAGIRFLGDESCELQDALTTKAKKLGYF